MVNSQTVINFDLCVLHDSFNRNLDIIFTWTSSISQSHEVRLNDLARGFEEATIDKNQQEEKTKTMKRKLESAAQLRKVSSSLSTIPR